MTNAANDSKRPVRIGLLVDSLTQPRWVSKILNDIQSSDFAELCLIVKNEATSEPLGRLQSYWKNRNYLLYALYNRVDSRVALAEENAFEDVDLEKLLSGVPILGVMPVMKKFSDWFPDDAVEKIRSYDLDVVISHGFRILRGEALCLVVSPRRQSRESRWAGWVLGGHGQLSDLRRGLADLIGRSRQRRSHQPRLVAHDRPVFSKKQPEQSLLALIEFRYEETERALRERQSHRRCECLSALLQSPAQNADKRGAAAEAVQTHVGLCGAKSPLLVLFRPVAACISIPKQPGRSEQQFLPLQLSRSAKG